MAKKKAKKKAVKKRVSKKKVAKKKKSAQRELIDTGRDKRYVQRDDEGQFKESDDVGRSLSADRRKKAKRKIMPGQGDIGDR